MLGSLDNAMRLEKYLCSPAGERDEAPPAESACPCAKRIFAG